MFIPAFIMHEPLRALFMPLTVAVGFAMISAYILSTTFVPVLCVYLLKHHEHDPRTSRPIRADADRLRPRASSGSCGGGWCGQSSGYLAVCGLILWLRGGATGDRVVSAGRFGRVRPPLPAHSRLELQADAGDGPEMPGGDRARGEPENMQITMGFAGQVAPNFGMDNIVLFMRGPDDGYLRVALREGAASSSTSSASGCAKSSRAR